MTGDTPTGPIRAEGTAVDVTDSLSEWVTSPSADGSFEERAETEAAQIAAEDVSSALSAEFPTVSSLQVGITHVNDRRSLVVQKHADGDRPPFDDLVSTAPRSVAVTLRRPIDSDREAYRTEFPVWVEVISITLD